MVLAQVRAGRPVTEVADGLEVSTATVFQWKKQDEIDRGETGGLSTTEAAELRSARQRITELSGLPKQGRGRANMINRAASEDLVNRNVERAGPNMSSKFEITAHQERGPRVLLCRRTVNSATSHPSGSKRRHRQSTTAA